MKSVRPVLTTLMGDSVSVALALEPGWAWEGTLCPPKSVVRTGNWAPGGGGGRCPSEGGDDLSSGYTLNTLKEEPAPHSLARSVFGAEMAETPNWE